MNPLILNTSTSDVKQTITYVHFHPDVSSNSLTLMCQIKLVEDQTKHLNFVLSIDVTVQLQIFEQCQYLKW